MLEYPSIISSAKAPKEHCIAFNKLDGSNIRVKYTQKNGFNLFGSRHSLFDETHPFLAGAIPSFKQNYEEKLTTIFQSQKLYKNAKEIIVFGEYLGDKSFAGFHDPTDNTKKFIMFDVLLIYKDRAEFIKPNMFIEHFQDEVEIPEVLYEGNLNEEFIQQVRSNSLSVPLKEGVICKGTKTKGSFRGKVWMCKIKTEEYLQKLQKRFGAEWEKYAE